MMKKMKEGTKRTVKKYSQPSGLESLKESTEMSDTKAQKIGKRKYLVKTI
jgi:hypothetical protein